MGKKNIDFFEMKKDTKGNEKQARECTVATR